MTHINVTREHDTIGCELVVLLLILMGVWGSVCFVCLLIWEPLVHNIHWYFTNIFRLTGVTTQESDDYQVQSLTNKFHCSCSEGQLTFPGSRTPFAIFSLSSLHLPLLFISLLLLSPPLLKEKHFCSATRCAIFGPLCYLPFKDAVAVVDASRKYYTDSTLSVKMQLCVSVDMQLRSCASILHDGGDGGAAAKIRLEWAGCWLTAFGKSETRQK